MLGSDGLPPLGSRETNADDSPDQSAEWWESKKVEKPQIADVGMTGLYVDQNRGDEAGHCPKHKAVSDMTSSRGSSKNFKAIDFASAVSESITACTSFHNERVCGELAQMPDSRKGVCCHHESNRSAVCEC